MRFVGIVVAIKVATMTTVVARTIRLQLYQRFRPAFEAVRSGVRFVRLSDRKRKDKSKLSLVIVKYGKYDINKKG